MATLGMGSTTSRCKRLMKMGLSLFRTGFSSSKCKTMAKMATARIKLLRNKREVVVRQMRRDVALLLESRQDATARIRVEHVIREQNVMAANEIIELFCELVVSRLSIISKQRECPADLKEGISSLIFAAPRCADIPELLAIRSVFEKKYGKDFVSAATDLRPSCGVNRLLIEKLSVRTPTGEAKLKVMKEIAKEYQIEWDTTETEMELLKPLEEPIEGPKTFVSATSMPVKPAQKNEQMQYVGPVKPVKMQCFEPSKPQQMHVQMQSLEPHNLPARLPDDGVDGMQYQDAAWAAEAAAESAKQAMAAAQVAAYLANRSCNQHESRFNNDQSAAHIPRFNNSSRPSMPNCAPFNTQNSMDHHQIHTPWGTNESPKFGEGSHYLNNERQPTTMDGGKVHRRHTMHAHSDIKFDESDCDEEIEMERPPGRSYVPPNRPPPSVPSPHDRSHIQNPGSGTHPKLPDYDSLAARFDALKHRNSMP